MRSLVTAVLALLALPLAAANIRFDPPVPTTATPVTAHVTYRSCGMVTATATRSGNIIGITINESGGCIPEIGRSDIAVDLGVLPAGVYDVVASPGNLLVGVAEGILPVTEANPAFRIEPNVVNTNGGRVRIVTPISCPSLVVCDPVAVKFDGADATVLDRDPTGVTVQAPPHAEAIVNVTVQRSSTAQVTAGFYYFTPNDIPNAAFFEPLLIPVFYSGPGSFGSDWQTKAAMHNANAYQIDQPRGGIFGVACFPECDPRPHAGETTFATGLANLSTGLVDFLPRQAMPNLFFSLLVRDLSRDATDFGTSVPVVRENEMFHRTFSIVNVPADARYRIGLRLYAYDTVPTTFFLTIVGLGGGGGAVSKTVTLLPASDHAFAFNGDLLADAQQLIGKGPLRIDITPTETATRAWGYVTVTNNDTQHVTVIAPQ